MIGTGACGVTVDEIRFAFEAGLLGRDEARLAILAVIARETGAEIGASLAGLGAAMSAAS